MAKLVSSTPSTYVAAIATALFAGLRVSELVALRWQDICFDEGAIRCQWQLSKGQLAEPKTAAAKRDVVLWIRSRRF